MDEQVSDSLLIFLIPLISSRLALDWERVILNLKLTVQSILNSRSPQFMIGICHNAEDSLPDFGDSRVIAVPARFPPNSELAEGTRDKRWKVRAAAAYFRASNKGGNSFMFLDADDLVHCDLVAFVVKQGVGKSFVVDQGYCYDQETGRFLFVGERFHALCGSCFISYFDSQELPQDHLDEECLLSRIQSGRHRNWGGRAKRYGKKVSRIPFPAVLYNMNHSQSLRGMKTGFAHRSVGNEVGFVEARAIRNAFL